MSAKGIVGGGIMGLAGITGSILGLVIHVWTIIIAFAWSGLLGAVITLVFPVFSEAYWFFSVGNHVGYSANYCVAIMAYVGLIGLALLGSTLTS